MTARFALVFVALFVAPGARAASLDEVDFFERKIRPVLVEHCYKCHSAASEKLKGDLRLDSRQSILKGGKGGPAVVPGKPSESPLIRAVVYADEDLQMPPKSRLPAAVVDDLKHWVESGAPWPAETEKPIVVEPKTPDARSHWSLAPVNAPSPPAVRDATWPTGPVDQFILAGLEAKGLRPSPPADRRALIRRAYFDLTGLPPAPADVEAFAADPSPGAFAAVVDRLLSSPQYGERWGRHWLDLARYADTNGVDENLAYPNAWRYRDYVVRAFNADKPYDRFLTEQLAGDLLTEDATPAGKQRQLDNLIATGFLVLGPKMLAEQDKPKLVLDVVDEQIDVTGQTFLGLTLGCARCHDHKFDPITQADYSALAGIFKSTKTMGALGHVSLWNERELDLPVPPAATQPAPPAATQPKSDAKGKDKEKPKPPAKPAAMAVADDKPQDVPIYKRGSHLAPAPVTTPRGVPARCDSPADAGVHTARRSTTIVPQQALFMLNSELVAKQAELLAKRLVAMDEDDTARITSAYRLLYARPATQTEAARAASHLASFRKGDLGAWISLCRVLFAANEFIYVN